MDESGRARTEIATAWLCAAAAILAIVLFANREPGARTDAAGRHGWPPDRIHGRDRPRAPACEPDAPSERLRRGTAGQYGTRADDEC